MKMNLMLTALAATGTLHAYDYSVEFFSGVVANMNEDVTYKASDGTNIEFKDVELSTKSFTVPYYYGLRVSIWDEDNSAWEVEHTHQKLYMDDKDMIAPLEHWEMTDGFNFFFVNKAWKMDEYMEGLRVRVGAGLVITHPDITYDGVRYHGNGHGAITYGGGYDLSGYVWQAGVQKVFDITENWYISTEARLTYAGAWAEDESGGISDLQNRALHFNFGVGYNF